MEFGWPKNPGAAGFGTAKTPAALTKLKFIRKDPTTVPRIAIVGELHCCRNRFDARSSARFGSLFRPRGCNYQIETDAASARRASERADENLELATRNLERTETIEKESLWCVNSRLPRYRQ